MDAPAREANDLLEEAREQDPPLSIWLWIVPLLLLLAFVAVFATHRHAGASHVSSTAGDALPKLGVVQFDSGEPTLTPDGQAALDRAADAMRGNPNVRLRLEGYEASRGKRGRKDRRADPLALQRVSAVENYLDAKGIERSRVTVGTFMHTLEQPGSSQSSADRCHAELYAQ